MHFMIQFSQGMTGRPSEAIRLSDTNQATMHLVRRLHGNALL